MYVHVIFLLNIYYHIISIILFEKAEIHIIVQFFICFLIYLVYHPEPANEPIRFYMKDNDLSAYIPNLFRE